MAARLDALRADIRGLAGLTKATEDEVDALINEGHKELCVRSEWTRANVELGPLAADDPTYPIPTTVERILTLRVEDYVLSEVGLAEGKRLATGELALRAYGVYWIVGNASGDPIVNLYPTPSSSNAGQSLTAQAVVYPSDLTDDDDETVVPDAYDRGIRDYVASVIYGYTEDNPEIRQYHEEKFEMTVERLRRLQFSRGSRGGVRMKIEGMTA